MREREIEAELMDDPALAAQEHAHALRGLARINRLSGAAGGMWRAIAPVASELVDSRRASERRASVSVLDVAAGAGDVPCRLAMLAKGHGVEMDLTLLDASETALRIARENASRSGLVPATLAHDAVDAGLPFADRSFDVVTCSLFLHHLPDEAIIRVLSEMARVAARMVVVNDLRRSRAGLVAAHIAGRTLTRSRIVRVDSVRSVRAALTCEELRRLAMRAGLCEAGGKAAGQDSASIADLGPADLEIARAWPWRMLLVWRRAR